MPKLTPIFCFSAVDYVFLQLIEQHLNEAPHHRTTLLLLDKCYRLFPRVALRCQGGSRVRQSVSYLFQPVQVQMKCHSYHQALLGYSFQLRSFEINYSSELSEGSLSPDWLSHPSLEFLQSLVQQDNLDAVVPTW